jgi:ribosomal protein L37AE/L43A
MMKMDLEEYKKRRAECYKLKIGEITHAPHPEITKGRENSLMLDMLEELLFKENTDCLKKKREDSIRIDSEIILIEDMIGRLDGVLREAVRMTAEKKENKRKCSMCKGTGKMPGYIDVDEYYKDDETCPVCNCGDTTRIIRRGGRRVYYCIGCDKTFDPENEDMKPDEEVDH